MFNQAYAASSHLPIAGTEIAAKWDTLYFFLFWVSVFFFILTVGGMVYFAFRYRHSKGAKSKYITGNIALEVIWTIIPTVLLLVIFGWGYMVYNDMTRAPSDAMEIRVLGKQWNWVFQYEDGKQTSGEFFVPVNKPVKLVMTSEDVLHSFFIPNFRIKQDVVPGMYTTVWFEAKVTGQHQVFCTEYCGTAHSGMLAKAVVLDEKQWADWKRGKKIGPVPEAGATMGQTKLTSATETGGSLAEQGKALMASKGCIACHSDDGTQKIGPTYKGIYGHKVELADGSSVEVDDNYIRESIENPQAKVVKGFNPVMPTYKGMLKEEEINAVIAYIKSLK